MAITNDKTPSASHLHPLPPLISGCVVVDAHVEGKAKGSRENLVVVYKSRDVISHCFCFEN